MKRTIEDLAALGVRMTVGSVDGVLEFEWSGPDSVENSMAAWKFVADTAEERNATRIIVVENATPSDLTVRDYYEVVRYVATLPGLRAAKIAFVDLNEFEMADNRFGANIAIESGLTGHFCKSLEEARRYMEADAS